MARLPGEFDLSSILSRIITEEIKENVPQEELSQEANKEITNAQAILNLCNKINSHIDIQLREFASKKTGRTYQYYTSRKKDQKYTNAQLMLYGAQLIYGLRQFFTEEHLYFNFSSIYQEGGQQQISQRVSIDDEVFGGGQLKALGKSRAIGLALKAQRELQNLQFSEIISDRTSHWNKILELATYNPPDPTTGKQEKFKINEHDVYRSIKNDKRILATYSGAGKRISLYYDKGKNNYQLFNRGWLYQWYSDALGNWEDQQIAQLHSQILKGNLGMLFDNYSTENIRGTKEGDSLIKGRQVQSKFDNTKIISFNNIKQIIFELTTVLTSFVAATENDKAQAVENLLKVLETHFIPESVVNGNEWAYQKANEIINKLENIVK